MRNKCYLIERLKLNSLLTRYRSSLVTVETDKRNSVVGFERVLPRVRPCLFGLGSALDKRNGTRNLYRSIDRSDAILITSSSASGRIPIAPYRTVFSRLINFSSVILVWIIRVSTSLSHPLPSTSHLFRTRLLTRIEVFCAYANREFEFGAHFVCRGFRCTCLILIAIYVCKCFGFASYTHTHKYIYVDTWSLIFLPRCFSVNDFRRCTFFFDRQYYYDITDSIKRNGNVSRILMCDSERSSKGNAMYSSFLYVFNCSNRAGNHCRRRQVRYCFVFDRQTDFDRCFRVYYQ